jgi:hypothetical protein
MESAFGADFSGVRVHTGSEAVQMSQDLNAHAFTHGSDVYFNSGKYSPSTTEGGRLLAHELTHTVQQGGGISKNIQKFDSPEHAELGERASGRINTDINISNDPAISDFLTFGEMVALAGDYFHDLAAIRLSASTSSGRDEIRYSLWLSHVRLGAEPNVSEAVKTTVNSRYLGLLPDNESHFSAGGTASNSYTGYHEAALDLAFRSGTDNNPALMEEALTTEAFGHHYLSDMFSAGHVRTERTAIKAWYLSHFPNSVNQFITYMAGHMRAYIANEHYVANFFGVGIPSPAEMEARIRTIGGSTLNSFSLGDIVSLAHHNFDNMGLNVISDASPIASGPFQWRALGDEQIISALNSSSPPTNPNQAVTINMALAAMQASIADLNTIKTYGINNRPLGPVYAPIAPTYQAGLSLVRPYRALTFVPREDTTMGNTSLVWQWGSFNAAMRGAVNDAIRHEIVSVLREKAAMNPNPDVRGALNDFATHLDTAGIAAIEQAMGTASSGVP